MDYPCDTLSYFKITNESITSFDRQFNTPMDCAINALQIMGILDSRSANIMRITILGKENYGISQIQIELIFMYVIRHNFSFIPITTYEDWFRIIVNFLPPSNVVFAGVKEIDIDGNPISHIFLIGRDTNGIIVYIDPMNSPPCNIMDAKCDKWIKSDSTKTIQEWYLLFHSSVPLTQTQYDIVTMYIQTSNR